MRIKFPIVLFVACALAACTVQPTDTKSPLVTFVHLNDTYRIDAVEDGQRGGFGRVVTLLREYREQGRDVRLLHGGDFLYPSLESQLWNGEQMIEAFNYMHAIAPLYVTPGNHEFDRRTPAAISDAVRQSDFEWIVSNLELKSGDRQIDKRMRTGYVIETQGLRIGLFGLTLHAADGGNRRDYIKIDRNYVAAARSALQDLGSEADLVIGLTHLNLDEDREIAALRRDFPKFVLIAGGHEHEPEFEAGDGTRATIVKGASNARTVWAIDIFRKATGDVDVEARRIAIDETIAEDPDYGVLTARWRQRLLQRMPFLEARIGRAALPLDGRETAVRNEPSNWGLYIAEQMRGAFGDKAQLAFVNGGTLRIDDYIIDEITFEDIGRTFGFSSFLRHMTIAGADFKTLLEAGYRGAGPSKGYFPQIAGFRVCADRRRPSGQRIVSLQLPQADGWQDIDPAASYTLVAPDYLYRGGDGYDFSAATDVSRPGSELKYLVLDAVVRAQALGKAIGEPVDPVNPPVVLLGEERQQCWLPE